MADSAIDVSLLGFLEAQLYKEDFVEDVFRRESNIGEVAVSQQDTSTSRVVGTSSKQLESANGLIGLDHMYSKAVPEVGAETSIETSSSVENNQTNSEEKVQDETDVEICDDNEIDSDDVCALAVLDLIDLAAEFDQLSESSIFSCFEQQSADNSSVLSSIDSVATNYADSCGSPFMQMTDDTIYTMDSVLSPSSYGYGSLSPSEKSPIQDSLSESFFSTPEENNTDWQESFTLFPSLASYS